MSGHFGNLRHGRFLWWTFGVTGIINNVHNKGQKTILRILSARTVVIKKLLNSAKTFDFVLGFRRVSEVKYLIIKLLFWPLNILSTLLYSPLFVVDLSSGMTLKMLRRQFKNKEFTREEINSNKLLLRKKNNTENG